MSRNIKVVAYRPHSVGVPTLVTDPIADGVDKIEGESFAFEDVGR